MRISNRAGRLAVNGQTLAQIAIAVEGIARLGKGLIGLEWVTAAMSKAVTNRLNVDYWEALRHWEMQIVRSVPGAKHCSSLVKSSISV